MLVDLGGKPLLFYGRQSLSEYVLAHALLQLDVRLMHTVDHTAGDYTCPSQILYSDRVLC